VSGCFHCGDALPAQPASVDFEGVERAFCCPGCAQAALFIREQGLGDYYRLRESTGARIAEGIDFRAWDRADLLAEHSRETPGGREITVITDGMRCAACAWLIDRALHGEPGVQEVQANAITGRIRLRWNPALQPLSALLQRLAQLGYTPHLAPGAALEAARLAERRTLILRLGIAGLGTLQAMMFAEALYLDFNNEMPAATRDFFRWIAFLVSTPVVFYSGWPFIAGMLREADAKRVGMDTLIASSVLLAYGASLVETLRGGVHVWFDAAVMFVFLLLAARALEQFARRRANAVVDQLARARPVLARRFADDGSLETVPLAALAPGDLLQVAAGEALPADGELLDAGEFDEALLTGESRAVARAIGDEALAGSTCLGIPVRLRVARTGERTRLSQLVTLVEAAQDARPRIAETATRLSGQFVSALFVIAIVVFGIWWQIAPERAFEVALAVLVVSCPCALSLAIPAGLAVSHGALAKIGVLSVKPDAIDRLAQIDTVLFDKTGTLTVGQPRIVALQVFGHLDTDTVRRIAAALERDSGHPLAAAFALAEADDSDSGSPRVAGVAVEAATKAAAQHTESVALIVGQGVQGRIEDRDWRLGRADFAAAGSDDDGAVWLGDGHRAFARFELADTLRSDAAATVAALVALGIDVEIASGDGATSVAGTAAALGVGRWHARMSPDEKLARMRALQQQGHRVAMVGDGINDAPVLAGADVSLALGGGAALAHQAADLVLTGSQLQRLPQSITLARRTRRVLRQNLGWALAYNIIALPFAALGFVTPWLAALGMAGSSLLVTLNALRLARTVATPQTLPTNASRHPSSGNAGASTPSACRDRGEDAVGRTLVASSPDSSRPRSLPQYVVASLSMEAATAPNALPQTHSWRGADWIDTVRSPSVANAPFTAAPPRESASGTAEQLAVGAP
jgi:P-type Cu2+ transporter